MKNNIDYKIGDDTYIEFPDDDRLIIKQGSLSEVAWDLQVYLDKEETKTLMACLNTRQARRKTHD